MEDGEDFFPNAQKYNFTKPSAVFLDAVCSTVFRAG